MGDAEGVVVEVTASDCLMATAEARALVQAILDAIEESKR